MSQVVVRSGPGSAIGLQVPPGFALAELVAAQLHPGSQPGRSPRPRGHRQARTSWRMNRT